MTDSTTTTDTTNDITPPDPQAGGGDKAPDNVTDDKAPDPAAQIASLTATVAALQADKAKADAQAEEARKASLTESQRLAEDRQAVDAERKALVQEARKAAADRLGINPKAMALVPDVDPRTADGAQALEAWVKGNPEFCKGNTAPPDPLAGIANTTKGKLADIFSGKTKNPLITTDSLRKMYGG